MDMPLYTQAKITHQQAINEFADVILSSNMKPKYVKEILKLLQKFLPIDNSLPTTIEELFGAMISSENDWRLAQYFIKYRQHPSFIPSSRNLSNENIQSHSLSPLFRHFDENNHQSMSSSSSSSNSDDESELSPYDRLQQTLRPIIDMSNNLNPYYPSAMHHRNDFLMFDHDSQLTTATTTTVVPTLKRLFSQSSSVATTHVPHLNSPPRIPANYRDESDDETIENSQKPTCFEMNGYDLLNGGKRCRYE